MPTIPFVATLLGTTYRRFSSDEPSLAWPLLAGALGLVARRRRRRSAIKP